MELKSLLDNYPSFVEEESEDKRWEGTCPEKRGRAMA